SRAEVDVWRGSNTKVIEAGGKLVLPGFNDAHVHLVNGGKQLEAVQLNDATSSSEFVNRVAERSKKIPKGEWITGGDWDETKWDPPQMPSKELIDPVTPDTPVLVRRYDGHMALANSIALKLAGSTATSTDRSGGRIVHDSRANPTA